MPLNKDRLTSKKAFERHPKLSRSDDSLQNRAVFGGGLNALFKGSLSFVLRFFVKGKCQGSREEGSLIAPSNCCFEGCFKLFEAISNYIKLP